MSTTDLHTDIPCMIEVGRRRAFRRQEIYRSLRQLAKRRIHNSLTNRKVRRFYCHSSRHVWFIDCAFSATYRAVRHVNQHIRFDHVTCKTFNSPAASQWSRRIIEDGRRNWEINNNWPTWYLFINVAQKKLQSLHVVRSSCLVNLINRGYVNAYLFENIIAMYSRFLSIAINNLTPLLRSYVVPIIYSHCPSNIITINMIVDSLVKIVRNNLCVIKSIIDRQ